MRSIQKLLVTTAILLAAPFQLLHAEDNTPNYTPVAITLDTNPVQRPKLQFLLGEKPLTLSPAELESSGIYRVTTASFWYEGERTFEGPLLRDVLQQAGLASAAAIKLVAHDGYAQIIPREDWINWPTMLATREDGKALALRDKGPYRLIYPYSMDSHLQQVQYRPRWIWVIKTIEPAELP